MQRVIKRLSHALIGFQTEKKPQAVNSVSGSARRAMVHNRFAVFAST